MVEVCDVENAKMRKCKNGKMRKWGNGGKDEWGSEGMNGIMGKCVKAALSFYTYSTLLANGSLILAYLR